MCSCDRRGARRCAPRRSQPLIGTGGRTAAYVEHLRAAKLLVACIPATRQVVLGRRDVVVGRGRGCAGGSGSIRLRVVAGSRRRLVQLGRHDGVLDGPGRGTPETERSRLSGWGRCRWTVDQKKNQLKRFGVAAGALQRWFLLQQSRRERWFAARQGRKKNLPVGQTNRGGWEGNGGPLRRKRAKLRAGGGGRAVAPFTLIQESWAKTKREPGISWRVLAPAPR